MSKPTRASHPEVCHLNEGHAAFVVLGRARSLMKGTGQPFEVALAVTPTGNPITTHTAVPAGFDRFALALIERYPGGYARNQLGIPFLVGNGDEGQGRWAFQLSSSSQTQVLIS